MLRINQKALAVLTKESSANNEVLRKLTDYKCLRVAKNETQFQVIQNLQTKDLNIKFPTWICEVNAESNVVQNEIYSSKNCLSHRLETESARQNDPYSGVYPSLLNDLQSLLN